MSIEQRKKEFLELKLSHDEPSKLFMKSKLDGPQIIVILKGRINRKRILNFLFYSRMGVNYQVSKLQL